MTLPFAGGMATIVRGHCRGLSTSGGSEQKAGLDASECDRGTMNNVVVHAVLSIELELPCKCSRVDGCGDYAMRGLTTHEASVSSPISLKTVDAMRKLSSAVGKPQ